MSARTPIDWLDERIALRKLLRHLLDEPIPGGARLAYVFGSGLACLFVFQAVTGILLALFYSPSVREAWGSVYFLTHEVPLGWFLRGVHHWGASAMILVLVAHLVQVAVYGAYRPPRELGWWTGLLLMFMVLGFAFTGYLLPWDQKGYWATREVTGLVGTLPVVGPRLRHLLLGADEPGNLTLLRAYGAHVLVLPALMGMVKVAHVALFRRHGVTPHPARRPADLERSEPFWPRQAFYDLGFAALLVAGIGIYTWLRHGNALEAPGDPSSSYVARPEWYFRWLFELRRWFPAEYEAVGVVAVTTSVLLLLAALPVLDRSRSAGLRHRWPHVLAVLSLVGASLTLTGISLGRDAGTSSVHAARIAERTQARRAFALAALGIPPGGPDELYQNDPWERGRRLFAQHCQRCHALDGKGGKAPDLANFGSREWVRGVIADPTLPRYFGGTSVNGMEATDASEVELDLLTSYVLSLGGRGIEPDGGAELFEEKGCAACHARAGEEALSGPSLGGYLTAEWIAGAIRTPAASAYYGEQSTMPAFDHELTHAELDDLIEFLTRR